jgi:hypothetical protein
MRFPRETRRLSIWPMCGSLWRKFWPNWPQQMSAWGLVFPLVRRTLAPEPRPISVCTVFGVLVRCMAPPESVGDPVLVDTGPEFHLLSGLYAGRPVEGSMTGLPVEGSTSTRSSTETLIWRPSGAPAFSVSS